MGKPGPIPDSYWLIDGMLLAGGLVTVLKVRADAGTVEQHRDAQRVEVVLRSDAGQHEELR